MYVEQLFTGCLAEMAYFIESDGECAIIDPLRETTPYIELAKKRGSKIKYVFLTHFHADFVSGHVDLAKKTGATIVFGPNARTEFEFHSASDNEEFKIGNISLKLIHTPGHTMESSSYILIDNKRNTPYIFTGDALFIGDVGRPDLAVTSDLTQDELAGHLFDSLRNKIMPLPNDIIIYPAHGAGSSCGKNMSSETFDTLGNQKKSNYALRDNMTREEFIKEVTTGLFAPPQYFPKNVTMNKSINKNYDAILNDGNKALSVDEFIKLGSDDNVLIIDVRHQNEFVQGYIRNSLFFGLDGMFAPWVGTMIANLKTAILLITPEGRELETITRLSRVGFDNVKGFLEGGFKTWQESGNDIAHLNSISAEEFAAEHYTNNVNILDVRKHSEFTTEHIIHENIINTALNNLTSEHIKLDKNKNYFVHCLSGYRSVIAASILSKEGFNNLVNIEGGFKAMKNQNNIQLTELNCPSEL